MRLRKVLLAGAAAVAAGLMGITPTAGAGVTSINHVQVDGNTSGSHAVTGDFVSGTASYGGGTYGCIGGTVIGDATAGAVPSGGHVDFTSLNLICATPLGINQTVSIADDCARFDPIATATVTDGKTDTAVPGTVTLDPGCGTLSYAPCTADVQGSVSATYNETTQELALNGTGFSLSNQSIGCFGLVAGSVGLNNIIFSIDDTNGGIDFRQNP
jgi:hypothetical protein